MQEIRPSPSGPRDLGEFEAIARLGAVLRDSGLERPEGEVWIGDDAAVLTGVEGPLLLSTDLSVAGVHADLSLMSLEDMGWRSVAAALSDIAAMGGSPLHAVVGVAGPPGTDIELLFRGIAGAAAVHGCPVVGGDLSVAESLVVSVTVTGSVTGDAPAVLRSGAAPGDAIFVTGPLGGSAAGLELLRARRPGREHRAGDDALVSAHLRPVARLLEGSAARIGGATSMIDVSDGFAADLGHVADASGVGVVLEDVPVAEGASLEDALGGGEDYELVFTTPESSRTLRVFADAGLAAPVPVGTCTADPDVRTLGGAPLPGVGYEHRWRTGS